MILTLFIFFLDTCEINLRYDYMGNAIYDSQNHRLDLSLIILTRAYCILSKYDAFENLVLKLLKRHDKFMPRSEIIFINLKRPQITKTKLDQTLIHTQGSVSLCYPQGNVP